MFGRVNNDRIKFEHFLADCELLVWVERLVLVKNFAQRLNGHTFEVGISPDLIQAAVFRLFLDCDNS